MIILGAGMAGCLAGIVNPAARIYEAQEATAHNHKAVLRFRSDEVSKVTGIPFRKVKVYKGIWFNGSDHNLTPCMIAMYSQKVLGYITARSITNIDAVERFVAPVDFHQQMIDMLSGRITFDNPILSLNEIDRQTVISTIPMNVMAKISGEQINDVVFHYNQIRTTRYKVKDCDIHMTMYYPQMDLSTYRATLTGEDLIIEHQGELIEDEINDICDSLGIDRVDLEIMEAGHKQRYGKILDIDDNKRKDFIWRLSVHHNVFSLGRFAIWKNILLDDVLDDLYVIRRLINRSSYDRSKVL